MTVSRPRNPVLTIMIRNLEWKALALCLAKTKEREEKGKGGREGEKERVVTFLSLVWFVREEWKEIYLIGGSYKPNK